MDEKDYSGDSNLKHSQLGQATKLVHDNDEYYKHQGAIVPPLYQNSLFAFESWDDIDKAFDNISDSFVYSRLMNTTVMVAEKKLRHYVGAKKQNYVALVWRR